MDAGSVCLSYYRFAFICIARLLQCAREAEGFDEVILWFILRLSGESFGFWEDERNFLSPSRMDSNSRIA